MITGLLLLHTGLGFLAALIPFASLVGMELLVEAGGHPHRYQANPGYWAGLALVPSGTLVWMLGRRLNRPRQPTMGDPAQVELAASGVLQGPLDRRAKVRSRGLHTLFFVPMEWWGLLFVMAGLVAFVVSVVGGS